MSAFDNLMAECADPLLFDHHGDTATYTTPDGLTVTPVSALFSVEMIERSDDANGQTEHRVRYATIQRDTANPYGGITTPAIGAKLTVGGVEYVLVSIEGMDSDTTTVKLQRYEAAHVGRQWHKGKR